MSKETAAPSLGAYRAFMSHPFLAIIGGGNMGRAIVAGGVRAGVLSPARLVVAEIDATKHIPFAQLGVHAVPAARDALDWLAGREGSSAEQQDHAQLLLAVKPQMLGTVANEMRDLARGRVVITILAGTPSAKVREVLGGTVRVVRAMPNLPASIGQGCTAICIGAGAATADAEFALQLFQSVGPSVLTIGEELMDAFTALAGSGPAYLFFLAEAMERAAAELGFNPPTARGLVRQTLLGAAALLDQSPLPPAKLRESVTSKGGTTAAAMAVLEERSVIEAWLAAIRAAKDRGAELASGA